MDLEQIRREYLLGGLRRNALQDNPLDQFQAWMAQAIEAGIGDPTAMVLATVDEHNCPEQRIVLLKGVQPDGFVFFTNYGSAKAKQMAHNDRVSLMFPWHPMERQVRICGTAVKLPKVESLHYFLSRPKESQWAAWASKQSRGIASRQVLLTAYEQVKAKFAKGEVPLPDFWGGYRVVPQRFEFWQGGGSRLHDRFEYIKEEENNLWKIQRLAP